MLARTLTELFGDSYREGLVVPNSLRELQLAAKTLREHGARWNEGVRISRERLQRIGTIESRSAVVDVEAGVPLEAVESAASAYDLCLGFLPPGARGLTVAEFLEGPYAGLRPIPGGRLEPLPVSMRVVLPSGDIVAPTVVSPRSAAGPELSALHLGGGARAGFIVGATLRLMPRPRTRQSNSFSFEDLPSLLSTLRHSLADGCCLDEVRLQRRGSRFIAQVSVAGSSEGVERDARTLAHRVASWTGRTVGHTLELPGGEDRELSWDGVARALESTRGPLALFRLSLDALVVRGAGTLGLPLDSPAQNELPLAQDAVPAELKALYELLDPSRARGETP